MPRATGGASPDRPVAGWARLALRLLGYVPVGFGWRLYRTDPRHRQWGSLPAFVPVPRRATRGWPRVGGMERLAFAALAIHAGQFLQRYPRHWLAAQLAMFLKKAPLAVRVETALREQRTREAEQELKSILEIDPDDARARFLLGVCRTSRGDYAGAAEAFDQAAERMDPAADYHAARGRLQELTGELEEAKASYRRALERQPGHPVALQQLTGLGEMVEIYLGTLDEPERAFLPIEAYEEMIQQSWEREAQGVAYLIERSHFHLRSGQGRLALAAAERALARIAAAAPAAERAAVEEIEAQAIEAQAAHCRALIATERYPEAESSLEVLARRAPDADWTASCRGHLAWFHGDRGVAAEAIRESIARNPNRTEDLMLYLDPEFPKLRQEPRAALQHLAKSYPQSHAIQSILASLHMAKGDWREGLRVAEEAIRCGATEESLVELTGRLGKQGYHEEVRRLATIAGGWERFLEGHPLLRCNLAASLQSCGDQEAARTLWQSVEADEEAHPEIRRRAQHALGAR